MAEKDGSAARHGGLGYEPSIGVAVTNRPLRYSPYPRDLPVYVSFDSYQGPRIACGFVVMRLQEILPRHGELNLVGNLPAEASVGGGVGRNRFLAQGADEAITQIEVEYFRKIVAGLRADLVART